MLKKVGDFYTLGAMANFFEGQSGANVLSTPNLVALDNEEAKIVIGQNVPFVTGSYASTGTAGAVNPSPRWTLGRGPDPAHQESDRRRRHRAHGGLSENSSVVPGSSGTTGPTLDKSAIETSVVVDDGDIIVLGGLMKGRVHRRCRRRAGLSKIPLIGNLFKSENRKRVKTNLMVFLRPVVMRNAQAANELSMSRYEAIRAAQQAPSAHRQEPAAAQHRHAGACRASRQQAGRQLNLPPHGPGTPPYAFANAHTVLLEDDGQQLTLWAPPERAGLHAVSSCSANTPSTAESEAPASLATASTPPTRAASQRAGGRRGRKRRWTCRA